MASITVDKSDGAVWKHLTFIVSEFSLSIMVKIVSRHKNINMKIRNVTILLNN